MSAITILQPGFLTTVQDLGRWGFQSIGMPVAGVMDDYAARVGNLLLGNAENTPVLEISLLGPVLQFEQETFFVLTGGDLQPRRNEQPLANWTVYAAQARDVLSFAGLRSGCRAYLAVAGSFRVEHAMGSASTYLRGKLGGYHGRALQAGDVLTTGRASSIVPSVPFPLPAEYRPDYRDTLRVILGPQNDAFTAQGLATFLSSEYIVTNDADRMGYRLDGPKIEHARGADIISDGIAWGAIQVPAHGTPIIMLADRQTTGGYPKIANVITVDIPSAAQKKPGDKIRFEQISIQDAQQYYRQRQAQLMQLQQFLAQLQRSLSSPIASFAVMINGRQYNITIQEVSTSKDFS